jgi:hypothetical protein
VMPEAGDPSAFAHRYVGTISLKVGIAGPRSRRGGWSGRCSIPGR